MSLRANVLSIQEFAQNLKDSGLLTGEEIQNHLGAAGDGDGEAVLHHLQKAGVLTAYQCDAIKHRRFDELRIGNYDILGKLGSGGMGSVYQARHRRMKRMVALKVMSKALCKDENSVARFQREVETIARLQHPNIVLAFDADEAEVGQFLVMEFVHGHDLASLVQNCGPLLLSESVRCTTQAARGLAYAHSQGIVHRDIKPANLLRDTQGVVKITDLGLARLTEVLGGNTQDTGLTQAGGIVGTVDYMSPEQAFDPGTLDHRTDIYSLGCTLYFIIAGKPPYQGASVMATLLKHREAPIPSIAEIRGEVFSDLEVIYRKMVAKNPGNRYQSMNDVVTALERLHIPANEVMDLRLGSLEAPGTQQTIVIKTRSTDATLGSSLKAPSPTDQTMVLGSFDSLTPGRVFSVLLVEPSRTQAVIIRKYVQNLGIDAFETVSTGAEALEHLKSKTPSALVAALHLKDMTGVDLAKKLFGEANSPQLGFVLITSATDSLSGVTFPTDKVQLLHKPFSFEQLQKVLSTAVGEDLKSKGPMSTSGSSTILPM
jgi:serine/threonine protein kinase